MNTLQMRPIAHRMLTITCAVLISGVAQASEIRSDRIVIGAGYNSATGEEKGACVKFNSSTDALVTASGGKGSTTSYTLREVKSLSELRQALGLSAAASFGWGVFDGSAESRFFSSGRYTQQNSFFLVKTTVENPTEVLVNAELTPAALNRAQTGIRDFIDFCGDEVVVKRQTGGEFLAVIQASSASAEEHESLMLDVRAELNAIFSSASLHLALEKVSSKMSATSELRVEILRDGDYVAIPKLSDTQQHALDLPAQMKLGSDRIVTRVVHTKPIWIIDNSPFTSRDFASVADQRLAIERFAELMALLQERTGFLRVVRDKPAQFDTDTARVDDAILLAESAVATVKRHAEKCRRNAADCDVADPLKAVNAIPAFTAKAKPVTPQPMEQRPSISWVELDPDAPKEIGTVPRGEIFRLELRGQWRHARYTDCSGLNGKPDARAQAKVDYLDPTTNEVVESVRYEGPMDTRTDVRVRVEMAQRNYAEGEHCAAPARALLYPRR